MWFQYRFRRPLSLAEWPPIGSPLPADCRLASFGRQPRGVGVRQGLQAHPDLAVLVDGDALDRQVLAHLDDVPDALDPVGRDLGDVEEADDVGQDLDERPVFLEADDLAGVGLADLGLGRDVADHLHGLLGRGDVRRGDGDLAVVLDVDLGPGHGDDLLDDLAGGPDDLAHPLGVDEQGEDARRVRRDLGPRGRAGPLSSWPGPGAGPGGTGRRLPGGSWG